MPGMPSIESAQQAWGGQISKKLRGKKLTGAREEKGIVGKVLELEEVSLLGLGSGGGWGLYVAHALMLMARNYQREASIGSFALLEPGRLKGATHRLSLVLSWDFRLQGFCSFGKEA